MQLLNDVGTEMETDKTPASLRQRLAVAKGLRSLEGHKAKRGRQLPGHGWNGHIGRGVGRELDKEASARVAFVQLSG